jgi:hypothetical protein
VSAWLGSGEAGDPWSAVVAAPGSAEAAWAWSAAGPVAASAARSGPPPKLETSSATMTAAAASERGRCLRLLEARWLSLADGSWMYAGCRSGTPD